MLGARMSSPRGAARSALALITLNGISIGAMIEELRDTAGSGGIAASTGAGVAPFGDSQFMAFRLRKNDTAITAISISTVFARIGYSVPVGAKPTVAGNEALVRRIK